MIWRFLFAAIVISAPLLLAVGCGDRGAEEPEQKPPPVEVLAVREQPVIPRYEYVGRVEATDELAVRPRVEGYIMRRLFEEGSMVEKGQLLYEIDPQPFIATLDNRRAALEQARAGLQVAERNFRRGRQLVGQGFISKKTMDELQGTYEQAQAGLQAAQADVESAKLNLSYTKIYAPLTGRIGRSAFTEGSLVGPQSEPLTTVLNLNPTFVLFEVPQDQLLAVQIREARRLREGRAPSSRDIRIELPDDTFYPYPGSIAFVDNQINLNTGSVAVRAEFPNPDQLLVQGQFVRVSIRVMSGDENILPLVPQSSVLEDMQGRYVFVVDENDVAHRRYLELGQREGELWAVEKGLQAGERVIVNGLQRVVADRPVAPQTSARNPYSKDKSQRGPKARPEQESKQGSGSASVTQQQESRREAPATDSK
ncbi:efflux RND transporter periplasmic adaptor subunit [Microbulbifer hainanensis]|uniref:efflux RND transporter periplasmic adaptor subunit n=1 Tax=Microbulbifer hainanensis TaxID=2735675 RepID=UPI001868F304|nr:efflux RND transporter periplasmic adaptor subunit [Microbulbifer hainanensis]